MADDTDQNERKEHAQGAQQPLQDLPRLRERLGQQLRRGPATDRSRGRGEPGRIRSDDAEAGTRAQKRDVIGRPERGSTSTARKARSGQDAAGQVPRARRVVMPPDDPSAAVPRRGREAEHPAFRNRARAAAEADSQSLVRQYRQARRVLRNDDRLVEEMQQLGDWLGSTFAGIYREPEEAKRAWAKKVHEVGVRDAIKILKEEPETLGRVTKSKEELRRLFEDQERIPKVVREAEDYGRLAGQRLKPEERARLERQMTQASEQLRTRHQERDLRRDLQKHGLQAEDLNARQRSAARIVSQDVRTLGYGGRLRQAHEEGRAAVDIRGLANKDPARLAKDVQRARQVLEQQARRYYEKPDRALSRIETSFERQGAARTIRELGRNPERFGKLTEQAQRAVQRQEERRIAGMSRSGYLQGGSQLSDAAARYEVTRARQAIGQEPGKAVFYQRSARNVREGFDMVYQDGTGAERTFRRTAGRDPGSERYQRALRDLARNPERYGKLCDRAREARFSTQQVAPKLAAARRDLDRLKVGELKDTDRAMQALRQQQHLNQRLEKRIVRVPRQEVIKARIQRQGKAIKRAARSPAQQQAARTYTKGAARSARRAASKAPAVGHAASRAAMVLGTTNVALAAARGVRNMALGRDPV